MEKLNKRELRILRRLKTMLIMDGCGKLGQKSLEKQINNLEKRITAEQKKIFESLDWIIDNELN